MDPVMASDSVFEKSLTTSNDGHESGWAKDPGASAALLVREVKHSSKSHTQPGNSELEQRIAQALSLNPYLPKRHLRFETHAGRVILRGVVRSYFQKQMAQESLRKIDGIQEICNELEVVS